MKHKLVLTLTGEHLTLEVVKQRPAHRLYGLLGQLARFRQPAPVLVPPEPVAHVGISVPMTAASVPDALEQAWSALKKRDLLSLAGRDLEAHLGLTHTRLGLLFLADGGSTAVTSSACDAYAKAWAGQMWNIDPASQIIRWQGLENKTRLLISCVDRQVFDGLDAFSRQHGMRFSSCKPALLSALRDFDRQSDAGEVSTTGATTLIWTEASITARRSSVVQLIRYEGAQLQALWRGWLSPPTSLDGPDTALEGAIRRFLDCHRAQPGDFLRHQHWPVLSPAPQCIEHAQ